MSMDRRTARQLCTSAELELVLLSFPDQIGTLSPERLRLKRTRARALRDKYRDLLRRQKLATRDRTGTKLGRSPQSNLRTGEKATLFDEALGRFEAKLSAIAAAAKPTGKRTAAPASKLPAVKSSAKKPSVKSAIAKAVAKTASRSAAKTTPVKARKTTAFVDPVATRSPKAPAKGVASAPRPPSGAGYMSSKAQAASRRQKLQAMGSIKVQAHVGARGRRVQAKRDSRPR